jgi:hypothetical protein
MNKLFILLFLAFSLICNGQTTTINGVSYFISDGGGKNFSSAIVPKSNTIYQNYVFVKGFSMLTNGAAVSNIKIQNNTFLGVQGTMLFFGSYAGGSQCNNIEVSYNTMYGSTDSVQYRWEFQNCFGVNIHNNYIYDMIGKYDGGVFYMQYSQGNIHNNFLDRIHGKAFRCWWAKSSLDTIINNVVLNTDMYSAVELQEVSGYLGLNTGWNCYIGNNIGGNYIPSNGAATAFVTLYFPGDLTVGYQFVGNVVFNTSVKLLDNSGTTLQPWAPTNSNWSTTNFYYATQALAGYTTDSLKLPDGTSWNGSASTTPIPPICPVCPTCPPPVVCQVCPPPVTCPAPIVCPICPICPVIPPARTVIRWTYDSSTGVWTFYFSDGGTQTN